MPGESASVWLVITTGRGALMRMENDSVSLEPVKSLTRIVNANRPSVVGLPVIPPELTPWVNSRVPGGICPDTTLNWTGFSDVWQPLVEKNHVLSVPTLPSANVSGTTVHVPVVAAPPPSPEPLAPLAGELTVKAAMATIAATKMRLMIAPRSLSR